jgi:hypothetical protein
MAGAGGGGVKLLAGVGKENTAVGTAIHSDAVGANVQETGIGRAIRTGVGGLSHSTADVRARGDQIGF